MLGDKLGEAQGKVTSQRVLPGDDYRYVKLEITFEASGTLLGVQGMTMGTYVMYERVAGQLYGEGQGIFLGNNGESAIWKGHGVGRPTGDGMGTAIAYSTAYQAGPGTLERLNGVLVVGEHHVDATGATKTDYHEWKA